MMDMLYNEIEFSNYIYTNVITGVLLYIGVNIYKYICHSHTWPSLWSESNDLCVCGLSVVKLSHLLKVYESMNESMNL